MNKTRKFLIGILSAMTITTLSPVTSFATTVRKITYQYGQSIMSGPALKSGTYIATVEVNSLDIYKSMTSNETIGKASKGDVFQILEDMGSGYARVSYNDVEGYMSIKTGDASIEELESVEAAAASATQKIMETKSANKREEIANFAKSFVGGRYIYGGTNPYIGADCSGFVKYILANAAGVGLPRTFRAVYKRYYSSKCRPATARRSYFLRFRQICKPCCYVYRRRKDSTCFICKNRNQDFKL